MVEQGTSTSGVSLTLSGCSVYLEHSCHNDDAVVGVAAAARRQSEAFCQLIPRLNVDLRAVFPQCPNYLDWD